MGLAGCHGPAGNCRGSRLTAKQERSLNGGSVEPRVPKLLRLGAGRQWRGRRWAGCVTHYRCGEGGLDESGDPWLQKASGFAEANWYTSLSLGWESRRGIGAGTKER